MNDDKALLEAAAGKPVAGEECPHCRKIVPRICHTPAEWMKCPRMTTGDPATATRRAIVRAAADLGQEAKHG